MRMRNRLAAEVILAHTRTVLIGILDQHRVSEFMRPIPTTIEMSGDTAQHRAVDERTQKFVVARAPLVRTRQDGINHTKRRVATNPLRRDSLAWAN